MSYVCKKLYNIGSSAKYYKLFTSVITPLAGYFSMILIELYANSDIIMAVKSFITFATGLIQVEAEGLNRP